MIYLALIAVLLSFVFYTIDAYFCCAVFFQLNQFGEDPDSYIRQWWLLMPLLTGLFAISLGLGAYFGDWNPSRKEDLTGTLLLIATPFILVWSGILDLHSSAVIDFYNTGVYGYLWNEEWWLARDWWWMRDPYHLGFSWSLPGQLADFFYQPILHVSFVVLGAIIGVCILILAWYLYLKHT